MKSSPLIQSRLACFGVMLAACGAFALDNSVARTPPMGWSSWNIFYGDIDESKIKQIADAMVSGGLRDAGYTFLNLDDNWMANPARDVQGNLVADPVRFPNGIKSLADYVHAKGLKLGVYSDRGTSTCMGIPQSGGYQNEDRDATTYASWGVDYLKYDNCNATGDIQADYTHMRDALARTGRPIVFSICAWHTESWMPSTGNLWRTTGDINANWDGNGGSVTGILDQNAGLFNYSKPGAWADPDMLEVGNGYLTDDENRAHFGLWALMAAPLITGNDLRVMPASVNAILTNPEVIAVDQDSAGIQGRRIRWNASQEIWAKPMGTDGSTYAVGLLNRSATAATISVRWDEIGLASGKATARDLWNRLDLGSFTDTYSATVPAHGLVLLKVTGIPEQSPKDRWVSDMRWTPVANGWGTIEIERSNGESGSGDGNALRLAGTTYAKGIGAHAPSEILVPLNSQYDRFTAQVGVDDEVATGSGSVIFQVWADGIKLYESPLHHSGDVPASIDVSVAGRQNLTLKVLDGGDGANSDHADWASARLIATRTIPEPCSPAVTISGGHSGNLNTIDTACYKTTATIQGWGCSNFDGRTLKVNGVQATCGQLPLPAPVNGATYFDISAGTYAWANFWWW